MCTTANGTGQGCDTAFGGCGAAIEQDASRVIAIKQKNPTRVDASGIVWYKVALI